MLFKKKERPAPPELTAVSPPFIRNRNTTAAIMLDVIIALMPAAVWGVIVFGTRALTILLISVGSCLLFEFLTRLILKRNCSLGDLSAVVTGLLLGLNLPVTVSYWVPVAGAFVSIVIVKQLFGGIGKNYLNPALAGRAILFAFPGEMTVFTSAWDKPDWKLFSLGEQKDAIASALPLDSLASGKLPDESFLDLFLGKCSGSIGEISALLLLLGGLYLICRRVIEWRIPAAFIGTVAALAAAFPRTENRLESMAAELLCGGLVIGAVFMATDYSTSPVTSTGKILYGIGCGGLTVLIRYYTGNEGVFVAILIMNLTSRLLDRLTMPRIFGAGGSGKKTAAANIQKPASHRPISTVNSKTADTKNNTENDTKADTTVKTSAITTETSTDTSIDTTTDTTTDVTTDTTADTTTDTLPETSTETSTDTTTDTENDTEKDEPDEKQ